MRLATCIHPATGTLHPFVETPTGERIHLAGLFPAGETPPFARSMRPALEHLPEIRAAFARPHFIPHPSSFIPPTWPLAPPVPDPLTFRDFYAFEQHVATCRARRNLPMNPDWYNQPVFYFSNPTSLVGHEQPVYAPAGCAELDYELELGLVIGKAGRDITPNDAWAHVAGFTIVNDFSARDLQRAEMSVGLGPAKGKDFATAVGPALVTLDDLRDRIDPVGRIHLRMAARVNGRELSRGQSGTMYFTWPQIVAHASRDATLHPGDLLASGTVGTGCILELGPENTGGWLNPGDVVELEVERLGTLRTPVVARAATGQAAPDLKSEIANPQPAIGNLQSAIGNEVRPCPST